MEELTLQFLSRYLHSYFRLLNFVINYEAFSALNVIPIIITECHHSVLKVIPITMQCIILQDIVPLSESSESMDELVWKLNLYDGRQ